MKNKHCSMVILVLAISLQIANAMDYVDLDQYKGYVSVEPVGGGMVELIEAPVAEVWKSLKASLNETVVADNISSEYFWNTLRSSVETGTFYNSFANLQTQNNGTGSDIFMRNIYRSIIQVPVKYQSISPKGDTLLLSGKIFLPKNKRAKNIIIANHYTICANSEAPSRASSIEGIYATKDYIVLMADYVGYGISDSLPHPYLHLESTVVPVIDLLKAAIPYLKANSYTFSHSVILLGYSQGAAVTLAVQKELEENYAYEFPITKVYAGAGPYDLSGTFDYYINNPKTNIPCSLPMLVVGMDFGENLGIEIDDIFQPMLQEKYPLLIESKKVTMNDVNKELGNDIAQLLKPIIFEKDSFPTSILYETVKKNSILQWTPTSEMYLFHSTQDDMVPFLNSSNIKNEFDKQDLDNIQYDFAPYEGHMKAAISFFEKVYKSL